MVGLASSPPPAMRCSCASSWAMPEPLPPIVKDGPDDHRVAELGGGGEHLVHRVADRAAGALAADALDDRLELLAVLAAPDRVDVGADELDAVALEHARLVQRHRRVQRRLAAEGREQRVGALLASITFVTNSGVIGSR